MSVDQSLADAGVGLTHHFGGGVYAKETLIPAGVTLVQHVHKFDHLSILGSGMALVSVDGVDAEHRGPACLLITAGKAHSVQAVTPVVWFCVHATTETDPDKVDGELIA